MPLPRIARLLKDAMGMDAASIGLSAVEQAARQSKAEPARPEPASTPGAEERLSGQEKAERELLRLMLANHAGARSPGVDEALFTRPEHVAAYRLLAPALASLPPGTPPDLGALLGSGEAADISAMLAALAMADRPLPDDAGELVARLQAGTLDRQIEGLQRKVAESERTTKGVPSGLLEELIALEHRRRALRSPA